LTYEVRVKRAAYFYRYAILLTKEQEMKIKFFSMFMVAASMLFASTFAVAQSMNVPTIKAKSVMTGLENPWDMAFTSGGDMFYTEKC